MKWNMTSLNNGVHVSFFFFKKEINTDVLEKFYIQLETMGNTEISTNRQVFKICLERKFPIPTDSRTFS